jgi:hypothetical protein
MNEQTVFEPTRRHRRHSGGWIGGTMLIALGLILLLQNMTGFGLHNWWALFILLPAAGAFTTAWSVYQETGHFNNAARGSAFGGMVLCLVSATFLFGLNWTIIGPVLLLVAGTAVLLNGVLPQ